MKIIGEIDGYDWIAQVSNYELDSLTGSCRSFTNSYRVGTTINICETWRKLEHILALQKDFDSVTKTLAAVNDLLDHVGRDIVEKIEAAGKEGAQT